MNEARTLPSFQAEFPEEPPVFSVVLDSKGIAWQAAFPRDTVSLKSDTALVWRGTNSMVVKSWAHLLLERGPLTLIWEGVPDVP
jgi:hypothetical protein